MLAKQKGFTYKVHKAFNLPVERATNGGLLAKLARFTG
ncbi:hypothetical protein FAES_0347 [Fibrella aestuarina BUZ 2]|uniref:Uncharacterized protein n=1 Tax=Fibrella aestuarina BUZ 2 TaxID=1166018 RepID=I0K2K7_9BACT|nr:hypothetical protein FAES_0347 [Fibrella aestuarina BUZ 2]